MPLESKHACITNIHIHIYTYTPSRDNFIDSFNYYLEGEIKSLRNALFSSASSFIRGNYFLSFFFVHCFVLFLLLISCSRIFFSLRSIFFFAVFVRSHLACFVSCRFVSVDWFILSLLSSTIFLFVSEGGGVASQCAFL